MGKTNLIYLTTGQDEIFSLTFDLFKQQLHFEVKVWLVHHLSVYYNNNNIIHSLYKKKKKHKKKIIFLCLLSVCDQIKNYNIFSIISISCRNSSVWILLEPSLVFDIVDRSVSKVNVPSRTVGCHQGLGVRIFPPLPHWSFSISIDASLWPP